MHSILNWGILLISLEFLFLFSDTPILILTVSILLFSIYSLTGKKCSKKTSMNISSRTLILLILCFIIVNICDFGINSLHVSFIEEPVLDDFDNEGKIMLEQSKNQIKSDVISTMHDSFILSDNPGCSTSECFESVVDEYYLSVVDENHLGVFNISGMIERKKESCIEMNYSYCDDEESMMDECLSESFYGMNLDFSSFSVFISIIESLDLSQDLPESNLVSQTSESLYMVYLVASKGMDYVRMQEYLDLYITKSELCLNSSIESGMSPDEAVSFCTKSMYAIYENYSDTLQLNIPGTAPLEIPSCSECGYLEFVESWRKSQLSGIGTSNPVLRYMRIFEALALEKCNLELYDEIHNSGICTTPNGLTTTAIGLYNNVISAEHHSKCVEEEKDKIHENFLRLLENGTE